MEKRMKDYLSVKELGIFSELADKYFDNNFGSLSKTDIDLLLFKIFYREMEIKCPNILSDVRLSFELGITKQKVRSLRERMETKYPTTESFEWQTECLGILKDQLKKYPFSNERDTLSLFVPSVRTFYYMEEFLENMGEPVHYERNQKVIKLTVKACGMLLLECSQEKELHQYCDVFKKFSKVDEFKECFKKRSFWDDLTAKSILDAVTECLRLANSVVQRI